LILAVGLASLAAECNDGSAGDLVGTSWQLDRLDGRPALTETAAWLRFEEGDRFGGSTGCNSIGGTWTSDGSKLTLSEIMTTLIACPGAVGEQEAAFNTALGEVVSYAIDGETLTLMDSEGAARMILQDRGETTPAP